MNSLWRILSALSLALLCIQGAFAHEHASHAMNAADAIDTAHVLPYSTAASLPAAHCRDRAVMSLPCSHNDSTCCMTACCVHCAPLFMAFHFEPAMPSADTSLSQPEASHGGITRAPLLRPPIT